MTVRPRWLQPILPVRSLYQRFRSQKSVFLAVSFNYLHLSCKTASCIKTRADALTNLPRHLGRDCPSASPRFFDEMRKAYNKIGILFNHIFIHYSSKRLWLPNIADIFRNEESRHLILT